MATTLVISGCCKTQRTLVTSGSRQKQNENFVGCCFQSTTLNSNNINFKTIYMKMLAKIKITKSCWTQCRGMHTGTGANMHDKPYAYPLYCCTNHHHVVFGVDSDNNSAPRKDLGAFLYSNSKNNKTCEKCRRLEVFVREGFMENLRADMTLYYARA